MRDSVDICDQGSFFVGGALKTTKYLGNSTPSAFFSSIVVGQMYVSFQIPKKSTGYPIIMISGGAHTGASLESTPNGDEGWAPYALRHGFPIFVVDQAGRGRSGFDSSAIHEGKARLLASDTSGSALIPNFLTVGPNSDWTNLVWPSRPSWYDDNHQRHNSGRACAARLGSQRPEFGRHQSFPWCWRHATISNPRLDAISPT